MSSFACTYLFLPALPVIHPTSNSNKEATENLKDGIQILVKNLGATYKESLVLYEISINLHLPSFSEP
jgi:predicted RNase H-like HicB family nuclease